MDAELRLLKRIVDGDPTTRDLLRYIRALERAYGLPTAGPEYENGTYGRLIEHLFELDEEWLNAKVTIKFSDPSFGIEYYDGRLDIFDAELEDDDTLDEGHPVIENII